jgi:hypothetical protein
MLDLPDIIMIRKRSHRVIYCLLPFYFLMMTMERDVAAFTHSKYQFKQSSVRSSFHTEDDITTSVPHRHNKRHWRDKKRKYGSTQCDDDDCDPFDPCGRILHQLEEDDDLDRREAAFAMIGTLWAVTSTAIIPTSLLFPTTTTSSHAE